MVNMLCSKEKSQSMQQYIFILQLRKKKKTIYRAKHALQYSVRYLIDKYLLLQQRKKSGKDRRIGNYVNVKR